MEVIVYMKDGNLCRVTPAPNLTVEQVIKDVPKGVTHKIVDGTKMPSYIIRNAWKLDGDSVQIDLVKGKEEAHSHRRFKRTEMLEANTAILAKNGAGIPLSPSENAADAASENASYMSDVDDVAQTAIDAATNESELLSALSDIGVS
jgi:hypothetical protein